MNSFSCKQMKIDINTIPSKSTLNMDRFSSVYMRLDINTISTLKVDSWNMYKYDAISLRNRRYRHKYEQIQLWTQKNNDINTISTISTLNMDSCSCVHMHLSSLLLKLVNRYQYNIVDIIDIDTTSCLGHNSNYDKKLCYNDKIKS